MGFYRIGTSIKAPLDKPYRQKSYYYALTKLA